MPIRRRSTSTLDRTVRVAEAQDVRSRRAPSRRRLGAVMTAIGIVLVPTAALTVIVLGTLADLRSRSGHSSFAVTHSPVVGVALLVTGYLLLRARRYRARSAQDVRANARRPTILYLRPFDADRLYIQPDVRSRRRWRGNRYAYFLTGTRKTYEQRLTSLLRKVAELTAIGDPTEKLAPLGAARDYFEDENWQERVDDMLADGGLILLHAGDSPGLGWEVERVISLDQPERMILSLPLHARGQLRRDVRYAHFRERFGDLFPRGLPEGAEETQYLYFDADWTPNRLDEPGGTPPEPAPGSPTAQRDAVLRKLAPEFRPMWASLWARELTYTAGVVLAIAVLALVAS
jgi:hypothetical protein